jgi:hypothetical protein
LQFEVPEKDVPPFEFKVALNYFAQTPKLFQTSGPVPGLTSENNFYDPNSGPGDPPPPGVAPLTAAKLDAPNAPTLPTPDPADDATFLRFSATKYPTAGPNKVRVGAQ